MSGIKKNRIWASVLQEQTLCETISKISGLDTDDNKVKREVETYGIHREIDEKISKSKNIKKSKKKKKKRLEKNKKSNSLKNNLQKLNTTILNQIKNDYVNERDKSLVVHDNTCNEIIKFDESKNRDYIKANEFDSDEIVCKEIVKQLEEKKSDLISKYKF
jgi:hypothetical protein